MSAQPIEQDPTTAEPKTTPEPENSSGMSRRSLLGRGAAGGLGVVLAGSLDSIFGATAATAAPRGASGPGYGPLVNDPAGLLSLPRGFSYTVIAQSGVTLLDTGEVTPGDPDGTASFPLRSGSVLVNNHEVAQETDSIHVPQIPGYVYDPSVGGGTTNIEVDKDGKRIREYVSLAGTDNNCAGGKTPWDTWLTCEETESRIGQGTPARTKDHGYVFEVDPYEQHENKHPQPLKALGRFAHEAVVVDPREPRLYLTEDASGPNGLLYRWTADRGTKRLRKGSLNTLAADAGTLEAMQAYNRSALIPDLSVAQDPGITYRVKWVQVPDRDARTVSTRKQFTYLGQKAGEGLAGPITRSRKLEGMWWGDGGTYFVASFARNSDGSAAQHDGQVWFLDPEKQTITLKVVFKYTPTDQDTDTDGPDNITVSPLGGVILAEDGDGVQHLVGADDRGRSFFLARNDLNESEFTGPNFSSHSRDILFANIQTPGYVLAIKGPWKRD